MKSTIKLPEKIKVGFQKRSDTYTGHLAYVIYYDNKGILRKETSWDSWRDKEIEAKDFDNVPLEGFVINKKVGGHSNGWNHRNAHIRIYDPRGFEFEISPENLLYILEFTNSIKGKGLEGEFVYGWDGKDNVLLPVECPDYAEIKSYNTKLARTDTIKAKELKVGATYLTNRNEEVVFLGRYDYHSQKSVKNPAYDINASYEVRRKIESRIYVDTVEKMNYFFELKHEGRTSHYAALERKNNGAITKYLIDIVSEECHAKYSEFYSELETKSYFSPVDEAKTVYEKVTDEETLSWCMEHPSYGYYTLTNGVCKKVESGGYRDTLRATVIESNRNWQSREVILKYYTKQEFTADKMLEDFPPYYKLTYLQNGKLHRKEFK